MTQTTDDPAIPQRGPVDVNWLDSDIGSITCCGEELMVHADRDPEDGPDQCDKCETRYRLHPSWVEREGEPDKAREFDTAFDALESALRDAKGWLPDPVEYGEYEADFIPTIEAAKEKIDAALSLAEAVRS